MPASVADLDGVLQHVLAVAGAVMQAAQQLHQLGMQAADAGLQARRARPRRLMMAVHLAAGLLHHLLDVGGMDAAVGDELFQRQPRDLAADRLEAGDGDGFGRIVDDEIDTGQRSPVVRMLRPSRPMMRPFISSLGRGTTLTVISATWSAAQRWMAVATISRARWSASSLARASIFLDLHAPSRG